MVWRDSESGLGTPVLTTLLSVLHIMVFAALLLRVLARSELSSPTRIAWVLVLLALPVIGLVLYLLVGEVHFGRGVRARQVAAIEATRALVAASGHEPDIARWGPASAFATSINGFGVTEGNHGELMPSPEAARGRILEDFDAAKESIGVLYYIWLDDKTGRATAEALMRAARRGVRCKAIVDAVGSRAFVASETWAAMAAAGIETAVALPIGNPFRTMVSRRLDLRNHRKITVIDGKIGHCGSQNCADPEFWPKRKFGPWVDIMVRLEGPVVRQMQLLFAQDWLAQRPAELPEFSLPEGEPPGGPAGGFPAQAVGTGPMVGREVTSQLFCRIMFEAKRELIISTPYFVPGDAVSAAISGAALAGVKVTLIVPRRNDSGFVARASRAYYPRLVEAGVAIAEFNGGLLHSKTITVDGELAFMGSSNMDFRSFDLNFENDVLFRDPDLAGQIRARQMEYMAASTLVDPDEVRSWPLLRRIWLNAFSTFGPVL